MFNIKSIFAGWMDIAFGEKGEKVFSFSYIEDVKKMLDNLFNLEWGKMNEKTEEFDLEGTDLMIHTHLYGDNIHIFCSVLGDKKEDYHYIFKYKDFLRCYFQEMSDHKEIDKQNSEISNLKSELSSMKSTINSILETINNNN